MKTVKLTAAIANQVESNPWLVISENEVVGTFKSRTLAREAKAAGLVGSVKNVSEIEFEVVKPVEASHPFGYETHGFDNCPHCNIGLDNGVLQNGDEVGTNMAGDGKILHLKKFEYYCMACGEEFGPELETGTVKEKTIRGPIAHVSTVEHPCKLVWGIAIDMKAANPLVKRGEVLAECVRRGVAYYTARTQYQQWLSVRKEEEATRLANEAKSK